MNRIGVAIGQHVLGIACPLALLRAKDGVPINWNKIDDLNKEHQPKTVLVGLPLNMDDSENEMCRRARRFAKKLGNRLNTPYHMVDERLSSFEAKSRCFQSTGKKRFLDALAAQTIIETWFAQ